MKSLVVGLLAVSVLSGCVTMLAQHTPASMGDGSQGFFVSSTYGAINTGSKETATKTLERYSNTLCPSGYKRLGEYTNPFVTPYGYSGDRGGGGEIHWEIKCNKTSS